MDDAWTVADPTLCPFCGRESCEGHEPPDDDVPPPTHDPQETWTYADRLARALENERIRRDVRRMLDAEEQPAVPIPSGVRLRDGLAKPTPAYSWRIQGWQQIGTRVLVTAQYKSGKTILRDNYIRSIVDGDPFLGVADVTPITGTAVVIDLEMSEPQIWAWLRCQCIRDDDRIVVYSLRNAARSFDLLNDRRRAEWAARLRDDGAEAVILDCVRPALDAVGLDEHKDAGRFLVAFDQLLADANIGDALAIHHMGHANERARGDSRLRDWPDAEWRIVRKDDDPGSTRFIAAYGRDVDVSEGALTYDSLNRHLTLSGGSRAAIRTREALAAIVAALKDAGEPLSGRGLKDQLSGIVAKDVVDRALAFGVQTKTLAVQVGPRKAKLYRVVGS